MRSTRPAASLSLLVLILARGASTAAAGTADTAAAAVAAAVPLPPARALRLWVEEAGPRLVPCLDDPSLRTPTAQTHLWEGGDSRHRGSPSRLGDSSSDLMHEVSHGWPEDPIAAPPGSLGLAYPPLGSWRPAGRSSGSDHCVSLMANATGRVWGTHPHNHNHPTDAGRSGAGGGGEAELHGAAAAAAWSPPSSTAVALFGSLSRCPAPWYRVREILPEHVSWSSRDDSDSSDDQGAAAAEAAAEAAKAAAATAARAAGVGIDADDALGGAASEAEAAERAAAKAKAAAAAAAATAARAATATKAKEAAGVKVPEYLGFLLTVRGFATQYASLTITTSLLCP